MRSPPTPRASSRTPRLAGPRSRKSWRSSSWLRREGSPQAMNSGTIKSLAPQPNFTALRPGIRDPAAGGGDHGVAGRDVPFAGRGEAGIDIGFAFGDPAEFDRRAEHGR